MEYESITQSAKTVEDAQHRAVTEACSKYGITEEDLEIRVIQEPLNKLFKSKPALVEVSLKQECIIKLTQKAKEEEEARKLKEEQLKLKKEELRREREKQREEAEEREKEQAARLLVLKLQQYSELLPTLDIKLKKLIHYFPRIIFNAMYSVFVPVCYAGETKSNYSTDDMLYDMLDVFVSMNNSTPENPKGNYNDAISMFKKLFNKHVYIDRYTSPSSGCQGFDELYKSWENEFYKTLDRRSLMYVRLVTGSFPSVSI